MSDIKPIQFVKKLTRKSKAPFPTASTSLWLANVVGGSGDELRLDYSRYLYVHRDDVGKITGISISKGMVDDHPNIDSQYLTGDLMLATLLFYIGEIEVFCEHWSDEFEQFFLLPPDDYFEAASWRWNALIGKIKEL